MFSLVYIGLHLHTLVLTCRHVCSVVCNMVFDMVCNMVFYVVCIHDGYVDCIHDGYMVCTYDGDSVYKHVTYTSRHPPPHLLGRHIQMPEKRCRK